MTDTITLDAPTSTETVVEGPGWRQVTRKNGGRYYIDVATGEKHTSISGLPWCDDFSGAARWMAGSWVAANLAELASVEDVRRAVAIGAEAELDAAAARGTAVHHYIEAVVTGKAIDWVEIDTCGADAWLPAVDAYLAQRPERTRLTEVVVFGETEGVAIAGTVDEVDLAVNNDEFTVVRDFKTRTTTHDRRPKEAAQLGGYAECLVDGHYVDARGRHKRLWCVDWCEVVTFAPDGTWAVHRVETYDALRAHRTRMALAEGFGVADLFAKAERGAADDIIVHFQARLDALDPESKMQLACAWRDHNMPRINELTQDRYATAARLFQQVEPFPHHEPQHVPLATNEQSAQVARHAQALPKDLRDQYTALTGGIRSPGSVTFTTDDLEDHERALVPLEATAAARLAEIRDVLRVDLYPALPTLLGEVHTWTSVELDVAYDLRDAIAADFISCDGYVNPIEGLDALAELAGGKRQALAIAKVEAVKYGRSKPSKFAEIGNDPVVFAAAMAAAKSL